MQQYIHIIHEPKLYFLYDKHSRGDELGLNQGKTYMGKNIFNIPDSFSDLTAASLGATNFYGISISRVR